MRIGGAISRLTGYGFVVGLLRRGRRVSVSMGQRCSLPVGVAHLVNRAASPRVTEIHTVRNISQEAGFREESEKERELAGCVGGFENRKQGERNLSGDPPGMQLKQVQKRPQLTANRRKGLPTL